MAKEGWNVDDFKMKNIDLSAKLRFLSHILSSLTYI